MPAPRKPSPSSPATDHAPALTNSAVAARVRQHAVLAEHRRAIAQFHARHAADQQARVNACNRRARQPPQRTRPPGNHQALPPAAPGRPVSDAAARHAAHRRLSA